MGKKKFRFAVGSKTGPRSKPWGLSISESDVFLYTRTSAGLWQFSFHDGGRGHLKIRSQRDPRGHEYVAIKDQPHDPPKLEPGEIQLSPLITLRFFTNLLSHPENPTALTKGVFVDPAPEGKITTLLLIRSRASSITFGDSEELANLSFRQVYKAGLANGETCYLMAMDTEGEFAGFKIPPSHGQKGWISPPADVPRYEYSGRIALLPNSEAQGYEVLECAGRYFDEPEFSVECAKFFPNG